MKTQIITLEPHDDLISVRDKLAWAKTPRILLVWPLRGQVDLRPLDLKLLQRHASGLGAQLALVTRSEEMLQTAQGLGLPVFKTATEAQRAAWPPRRKPARPPQRPPRRNLRGLLEQARIKEPDWLAHPVSRVGFFVLAVLAVLAVAALFIPRAEIRLAFASQVQSVDLPMAASPDFDRLDLSGSLPAHPSSLTLNGSQSTRVSGTVSLPQQRARGSVRFSNLTGGAVAVPAGTVVSTLGNPAVHFVTLEKGEVPAGPGETLDVAVEALEGGASGNCAAGSIQAIQGAAGLSLAVTNPQATSGGRAQSLPGPNAADRQRARDLLLDSLSSKALTALAAETGGFLLPDTLQAEIEVESFDPPPGQPGESLSLSLEVTFTANYVSRSDLERLGQTVLGASHQAELAAVPDSLTWEALTSPVTAADGVTHWQMRLERRLYRPAPEAEVLALVQGRPPKYARQRLTEALTLATPPQITMRPAWWPWLPMISTRTQIVYSYP